MLNNCVQMFARGGAGLAPELLTGRIWPWNLFLICGHWHQSAQVMGGAVDQAPGQPLTWFPNTSSCLFESNKFTDCLMRLARASLFSPPQHSTLMLNIIY